MTRKELAQLGWRIDRDGKAVKLSPTEPRKPHERVNGIYRSKTEAEYAQHLDLMKAAGVVTSYHYEAIKIRYTPQNTYEPDFKVVYVDGRIEIVEIKGHVREDDCIKCNAATAILWPWKIVMVRRVKGNWIRREF